MQYLLDTSTCIELMRGNRAVVDAASAHLRQDLAISTITSYELFTGVAKCKEFRREQEKVSLFCDTVIQLNFDFPASVAAGRIRADLEAAGQMIGPYDVLIAAHALSRALVLVTANTNEFQRVSGLAIENWR